MAPDHLPRLRPRSLRLAPACVHCGHPFTAAWPKPVAGIVVACVLGVLTLLWARGSSPSASPHAVEVREMSNTVHMLGSVLLLIGALLSAAGHRWGNRVVRATSWLMIVLVPMMAVAARNVLAERALLEGRTLMEGFGWVVAVVTVITLAPWLLYLFLFSACRRRAPSITSESRPRSRTFLRSRSKYP
jgi:drug/metabolite transporter (DMT)-like permease